MGTTAAKKPAAKKKPMTHPTYAIMIADAIKALKSRKGSSRQAIAKHIQAQHKDLANFNSNLRMAMKAAMAKGTIVQTKGTGVSGSFKLGKVEKPKKKVVAKKPAAKKAKKPAAKKAKKPAAKKPAAKKSRFSQKG